MITAFQQQTKISRTSNDLFQQLSKLLKGEELDFDSLSMELKNQPLSFLKNTIQGQALLKPFGYAGDFLMIDKIYLRHINPDPQYGQWDKLFHDQDAPQAVRNRKAYFKNKVSSRLRNRKKVSLLNIASGPARDLLELYNGLSDATQLQTTCVDMDENAIQYAKILNHDYLDHIDFVNKNILRFQAKQKYDLIWSAGLFDYFDDKVFLLLLNRIKKWLKPGGEIIIGNFNADHNPSRKYMEEVGEWFLNHRTAGELVALATKAGFDLESISVGSEPLYVNLFLHIKLKP